MKTNSSSVSLPYGLLRVCTDMLILYVAHAAVSPWGVSVTSRNAKKYLKHTLRCEVLSYASGCGISFLCLEYFCLVSGDFSIYFQQTIMRWWPGVGRAMRWLQLGAEKSLSRVIEKEEWAGASGATGKASSLLRCSTALWPCLPPSSTMCSSFTTWRHLCPSTRLINSPSGWARWVTRGQSPCH